MWESCLTEYISRESTRIYEACQALGWVTRTRGPERCCPCPQGLAVLSDKHGRPGSATCTRSVVQFHLNGFAGNLGQPEYVVEGYEVPVGSYKKKK